MKILLDESVPLQVGTALEGHEVQTVSGIGWAGISNGDLLAAAERERFHLLIVADKNLRYQQNLSALRLAILRKGVGPRQPIEI